MRYVSWFLSLFLHIGMALFLAQAIRMVPPKLPDIMEVELTELETPTVIVPLPALSQPESPLIPLQDRPSESVRPLPADKTVILDDDRPLPDPVTPGRKDHDKPEIPPSSLEPRNTQGPLLPSEVVEISPVKIPNSTKPATRIDVRTNDTIVHRGHEARFGRTMMADYYSYSTDEFSGQFTTKDNRTISIIDARNTKYGRFLIYDSKNKTLRRMKEFGKYVYTIGPSLYEDEPVTGSVTFLAKNDRIERFILMTDDDRIAHYPHKIHVREEEISFTAGGKDHKGYASWPPSDAVTIGVVFVHGNQCVEPGLVHGFTRSLSAQGIASLSFQIRGCEDGSPSGSQHDLVVDTRAALRELTTRLHGKTRVPGLWGNGNGVAPVVSAACASTNPPAFVVCLLDDSASPDMLPDMNVISTLTVPTFWLITGRETNKWKSLVSQLETLRETQGRPFTIVLAPLKASRDVMAAQGEESGWVENVSEDHARLAVSWIRSQSSPREQD
ncbi:alpha/beta hydrolase [Pseudodesulfovibrio piezophilus]|uniref:Alpha/beta hydrolase family protein n=1 Tax=Pseudodesulfovibrio piezophilus (strain DSM 21447 / JCM 15486 / C1TLV30) TaxID=1322246 RepID=M1WMJ6_PSEP2|nr:alpha/beta hydrolase [Pseudodesulfovibrio piezophilus]CCH49720.1 conserved protein of unknown function [Pseudodesulfovibrio piezophilus C1TLV30]